MFRKALFGVLVISLLFLVSCSQPLTACTEEAKVCPDGSSVGRQGPNCEFAECGVKQVNCTNEDRKAEFCIEIYQPVCGWNNENIKCIDYPCAATYSNSCKACQEENVAYWIAGECPK
jgi:hypothetical protein